MDRTEMLLRFGYYSQLLAVETGDRAFIERWENRAHEMTPADYYRDCAVMHDRLVRAGAIEPDEDPFEKSEICNAVLRALARADS
jgi:hypothetical protein